MLKLFIKEIISNIFYLLYKLHLFRVKNSIRIVVYHSVNYPMSEDRLKLRISPEMFELQIKYLFEKKYKVINLKDIFKFRRKDLKSKNNIIVITFDDGYQDNREFAFIILKKYEFPWTIFISTSFLEKNHKISYYWEKWSYLNKEDIKYLKDNKIEIGSHTNSHTDLTKIDSVDVNKELIYSKKILEEITGEDIKFLSYPHGRFNQKIKDSVKKAGYALACTSLPGTNKIGSDMYELRRIEIRGDDNLFRFKKKIYGCYDWLGYFLTNKN